MNEDSDEKAKCGLTGDQKVLARALKNYRLCEEREADNRRNYRDDIRFGRLSEQWDPGLKAQRVREGRPCLTVNKLPPIIRGVVNDARQNKPAIKVLPQDSKADPKTAEVQTDLIRNIESSSRADIAYDTAVDCAASGGFGYFRLNLAYAHDDTWDQDIVFEAVADPLKVYGDPHDMGADSSEWNVAFVIETFTHADFRARWPKAQAVDFSTDSYPDGWCNEDEIRVAEYWTRTQGQRLITLLSNGAVVGVEEYQENADAYQSQMPPVYPVGNPRAVPTYKVTQRLITGLEVLETNDWPGKYIPIFPVYGETVVLEGKRHFRSLIRDAKDAQVMFNAWRTASTELVALAPKVPFIGPVGAFETDQAKWETANSVSHPFIEYDGQVPPQRQQLGSPGAGGALQEALNASDDIKATTGIYDASLGARSNETSGIAIRARQGQSENSTFHIVDNLARAIEHCGRSLLDLIPKVYTVGRVLRTLGEDGTPSKFQVGDPNEQEVDPMIEEVGEILPIYNLGAGKYDLTVSVGPGYNTKREEAATQMIELIRAYPAAAPVIGDILVKNLDWPGADEIAERMQMAMQAQQQAQSQPQAQPAQVDPAKMAKVQLDQQQMQIDATQTQEKLSIDAFNAETKRMEAAHKIQQPTRLPRMPVFPG